MWLCQNVEITDQPPAEGDDWHVDFLPDDDPRVVAYVNAFHECQAIRERISNGDFTTEEITLWLAYVLSKRPAWFRALEEAAA